MTSRFKHLAKLITQTTTKFYNAAGSGTLTLSGTWPTGRTGRLSITVSSITGHTDLTGTITINGAEMLTFTAADAGKARKTTYTLSARPTAVASGLDCHILIELIDTQGQYIYTETETDLPCKIELKSKSVPAPGGSWTSIQSTQLHARGSFSQGDVIKFDILDPFDPTGGKIYYVSSVRPKVGYMGKESIKILEF